MAIATAIAQLRLDISNFSANMRTASKQMAKFAATSAKQAGSADAAFKDYGKTIREANSELTKHNFSLKDTARIVQSILVSQAFYSIASSIRDAGSALLDFNEKLDYANVTYAALFGSKELSDTYLEALKQQAEDTLFSFESLSDASRKLLAYGIPQENLLYITEGLSNLGAMSGDAAGLDRIALALGQIYTKGKLSAEEMRQLSNAYVPISNIIRERFNLSDDDMGRVGDLNLPAADVINAIVDYANEKFGGVGDAAMLTITGLKNKIEDTLKNTGVEILAPVTAVYKSFLVFVSTKLAEIRTAYKALGAQGIFEYLVPDPNTQQVIRQFLANIVNIGTTIAQLFKAAGQVVGPFMVSFMSMLNGLLPIFSSLLNIAAAMVQTITGNAAALKVLVTALTIGAAAWTIYRVAVLRTLIITALSKAIYGVSSAIIGLATVLAKAPILAILAAIAALFAVVAASANKANNAITNFFGRLTGFNGKSASDILTGGNGNANQLISDIDRFNQHVGDSTGAVDDLGDAADAAGKKAKAARGQLLSFDEVFRLNEDTDTSSDAFGNIGSIDTDGMLAGLDAFGDALAESLIPDIPDFSEFGSDFVNGLKDSLLAKLGLIGLGALLAKKLMDVISDTAFAGAFGAKAQSIATLLAKALVGAFIGISFDALIDPLTDKLWAALEKGLKLDPGSKEAADIGAMIGSTLGGIIGMVIGGVPGALIGAAIGQLAGGVVGLLYDEIGAALSNTFVGLGTGIAMAITKAFSGEAITTILKAYVTGGGFKGLFTGLAELIKGVGIKEIAKGGLIGMAVGFVTDAIAALLWRELVDRLQLSADAEGNAKVGQTIGSILGTIIGGILFGPPGALIGSAIGTFAGGFVGLFWEQISEAFEPLTDFISERVTAALDEVYLWYEDSKTIFSNWWSFTSDGFSTWWSDTIGGLSTWWSDTTTGFSNWWKDTTAIFSDWDSINSDTLSNWWDKTSKGFSDWFTNTDEGFYDWAVDTKEWFASWSGGTLTTILAWNSNTRKHFGTWIEDTKQSFSDWRAQVIVDISVWAVDTLKSIDKWVSDTKQAFTDFNNEALKIIGGFILASTKAIKEWCDNIRKAVEGWFGDLKDSIKEWWDGLWVVQNWTPGWSHVSTWFRNLLGDIGDWFSSLKSNISNWWDGLWGGLGVTGSSLLGSTTIGGGLLTRGYATGGIIDREQIARVGEGNRREAIIPLENESAMQPFVNAVSRGIIEGLAPTLAVAGGSGNTLPPLYVGTLVADDRGLKQLYKKFELIQIQESARKGLT